jgi:hypothetical protein
MKRFLALAIFTVFAVAAVSAQAATKRLQLYGKVVEIRSSGGDILQLGAQGSDIASTGKIYIRPGGSAADAFFDGSPSVAAQWLSLNPSTQNTSADTLQLRANSTTGIALYAEQTGSGYAGYFSGNVTIVGSLTSTAPKPAQIERANAAPLLLFAREAPESRFEDFGTVALVDGRAIVALDPIFREATESSKDYHVFLTPQDGTALVAVENRTADSFTIVGNADVTVAYNIVAVRRGDSGIRFTLKDLK